MITKTNLNKLTHRETKGVHYELGLRMTILVALRWRFLLSREQRTQTWTLIEIGKWMPSLIVITTLKVRRLNLLWLNFFIMLLVGGSIFQRQYRQWRTTRCDMGRDEEGYEKICCTITLPKRFALTPSNCKERFYVCGWLFQGYGYGYDPS